MKRSDLFREYARVIDMCEGAEVRPYKCVKQNGETLHNPPRFDGLPQGYTFAIGICEGKPVFAGDVLWNKVKMFSDKMNSMHNLTYFTWTKPDPYTWLKKALADGKVIQVKAALDGGWVDLHTNPCFDGQVSEYRIKPEPVVVTAKQCVGGSKNAPVREVMCTWTDGELSNVEIVK